MNDEKRCWRCQFDACIEEAEDALSSPCSCAERIAVLEESTKALAESALGIAAERDSLRAAYEQICEQCASAERELNEAQKANNSLRAELSEARYVKQKALEHLLRPIVWRRGRRRGCVRYRAASRLRRQLE